MGILILLSQLKYTIIGVQIKVYIDLRVAEYENKRENLTFIQNHQLSALPLFFISVYCFNEFLLEDYSIKRNFSFKDKT